MAIRRSFIVLKSGFLLFLIFTHTNVAGEFRAVTKTDEFTDYEYVNNDLKITGPEYLMVPWRDGELRYRVMEQDIVPVTVDSSRLHYARNPEYYLLSDRDTPLIQTGDPGYSRGTMQAPLTIHIARQNEPGSSTFQVIRYMRIRVFDDADPPRIDKGPPTVSDVVENPLSRGDWYKIPIPDDDIYFLDTGYLEGLGINVSEIDPRNIQIWTTSGYELPHRNSDPVPQLSQIPVIVEGESNGNFEDNDRIIFFANGPDRVSFDEQNQHFKHRLHPFTNENFVFLTVGPNRGERLSPVEPEGTATREVHHFRDFRWLEKDLEKSESRMKSGTQWFGQGFDPTSSPSQTIFTDTLAGFHQGSDIEVWLSMAARSEYQSRFTFTVNGSTALPALPVNNIASLTRSTGPSAVVNQLRETLRGFSLDHNIITINATYENPSSASRGWVEWIRIRADRNLQALNNRLMFHPPEDGDGRLVEYRLTGFTDQPIVLDITEPADPVKLDVHQTGNNYSVVHSSEQNQRFIARHGFRKPPPGNSIPNQDIRNPSNYPDYVIITASKFLEEAQRLADYRAEHDGLAPVIVTQEEIFNEFNGGVPDFVAFRNYLKFLYDRGTEAGQNRPAYLLLFGGTTYDYKGVIRNPNMLNHVFTYQSEESIHRTDSYGSDDFFGFMGDEEGLWPRRPTADNPRNFLDIGIGRFPVQTKEEARILVDKVKTYENPRNQGDWQTLFTFIADDDVAGRSNDRDLHILNADETANEINKDATGIRLEKIYQISYPFITTTAGRRVPQATQAMINRINDGSLVLNFSGHGSEQFLTDQRLFTSDDIDRLYNRDRLSIMITATCSFGRYDDTDDNSGAEKMLLYPDGGLIAALTTSRVAYTSQDPKSLNFRLNRELTRQMTRRDPDGRPQRLGDIYRKTKNIPYDERTEFNARKFILLGDPAMRIGLPESQIEITHINSEIIKPDTLIRLRALDQVTVSGHVRHPDGTINTTFDGEANIRVFDARRLVSYPDREWVAKGNCYLQECGYYVQTDALFNGRVSLSGGYFESQFVIPKDVSYSEQPGRIHTYARKRNSDATGAISNFRIQGQNPDAEDDDNGPDIEIYMNDKFFADGGIVNDSPQLIVLLSDNTGINTTGAGVGHEIVAIIEHLDNKSQRQIITLNDFYQSNLDDYTSGRIEYPLNNLDEGQYRLKIRAWDVFNNMGESEITFQVLDSQDLQIRNVYNYPNPMHNFTSFVFEHNQPGVPMDINIRLYTLNGIPVKTIRREHYISPGNMVRIDWHGRDDDHHRLATGTYLYHVQVRTETDQGRQTKDKIERLVILR